MARFLGERFPPDTPADLWAEGWRDSVNLPGSDAPNHGFLLRADGQVVGAYPVIYSKRIIGGRPERFCNLAVWYTAPEYRSHSVAMLRAILAQEGWHFTDLTPIEVVQKLNLRLGFTYLDTTTMVIPNFFWPALPRRVRVSESPAVIESSLAGPPLVYYRDHRSCRWARHLVLLRGHEACHIIWRRERHKRLSCFASIQYASNPDLLRREFRRVGSHLLLRHGAVATFLETRLTAGRVWPSMLVRKPKSRMFRSATLTEQDIDYLYSEITSAP